MNSRFYDFMNSCENDIAREGVVGCLADNAGLNQLSEQGPGPPEGGVEAFGEAPHSAHWHTVR
jgi:hypothetical protein